MPPNILTCQAAPYHLLQCSGGQIDSSLLYPTLADPPWSWKSHCTMDQGILQQAWSFYFWWIGCDSWVILWQTHLECEGEIKNQWRWARRLLYTHHLRRTKADRKVQRRQKKKNRHKFVRDQGFSFLNKVGFGGKKDPQTTTEKTQFLVPAKWG